MWLKKEQLNEIYYICRQHRANFGYWNDIFFKTRMNKIGGKIERYFEY